MINAKTVEGFTRACLLDGYEQPAPIPDFHREMWEICCSDAEHVAIGAPRGHAKSSAITLAYALTALLYRDRKYAVILSNSEAQAIQFLNNLKSAITTNDSIKELFGVSRLVKDTETDFIVRMSDGHRFRVACKGAGSSIRGALWEGKRPDLVLYDDIEEEETVLNKESQEKFDYWFFGSMLPLGGPDCKHRVVGTVLGFNSLLWRLLQNSAWSSKIYEAHNDDYSEILWPERFSKEKLIKIQGIYSASGRLDKYSAEYRNLPILDEEAYFRKSDFQAITSEHKALRKRYYAAIDFAISKAERADFTVIAVVGVDEMNRLYVEDIRRGRWDSLQIIDEMFSVHQAYKPELFTAESGAIEKSIGPFLNAEMFKRGMFLNMNPMTPTKDKQSRARSFQAKMKAKAVFFDKEADWFPALFSEMTRFPKGTNDDQVDALGYIGLTLDEITPAQTDEEFNEQFYRTEHINDGRSQLTGY